MVASGTSVQSTKEPKSNKKYWIDKIDKNVKRYNANKRVLKSEGYNVIIIWEHQMKKNFLGSMKRMVDN